VSKEMKEDEWMKKARDIEEAPKWLREGDTVEVVYGEFEEVETPRKDRRTGNEYVTIDFKVSIVLPNGSKAFRLVDKYTFVDLIKEFKAHAKDGVMPKTVTYRRPVRRRY